MKGSKRRGAVKVPNVILRPAQPQPSSSRLTAQESVQERANVHEDGDSDSAIDLNAGKKPFDGAVLCATGNVDKRLLFSQAQHMGAVRSNDFTEHVTHLVADVPGSAKYKCAVERNLPILLPSWVDDAYNTWLNGDVVNLNATLEQHRMPIFIGVRLCVTGMDSMKTRARIESILSQHGGAFLKCLDVSATHLLCSTLESPKIEWTTNYNQTSKGTGRIRMVWEEWFWDCLEFHGQWDESAYEISKPRPSRKSRVHEDSLTNLPKSTLSQQKPLPHSIPTSTLLVDDTQEVGFTNKQRDIGLRIFESITHIRESRKEKSPASSTNGHPAAPPASSTSKSKDKPATRLVSKGNESQDSVLSLLSNYRAASFVRPPSQLPQTKQPFRRIASTNVGASLAPQTSFTSVPSSSKDSTQYMIFAGYSFQARGEARGPTVRDAVEQHGGRWVTEEDTDVDFILIRLVEGSSAWGQDHDEERRAKYRTECWVEKCLYDERICDPEEHVSFTPLKINTPVEDASKLRISTSGLDQAELCWVKRLLKVLGAQSPSQFSRHTTHLICPLPQGSKYDRAKEWGTPVVSLDWLYTIARTGRIPNNEKVTMTQNPEASFPNQVFPALEMKSKVKVKDHEGGEDAMMDITNDISQTPTSASSGPKRTSVAGPSSLVKPPTLFTADGTHSTDIGSGSNPSFGQPTLLTDIPHDHDISAILSTVTPLQPSRTPSRQALTVEEDKRITRIPSSHSPSPLKIGSPTPLGETRKLVGSLTAVVQLGKRGAEINDEVDTLQPKPSGRHGKRPRLTEGETGWSDSPLVSLFSASSPTTCLAHQDDIDVNVTEEEASLRVIYEDPSQKAEKAKLIALFEPKAASNPETMNKAAANNVRDSDKEGGNAGMKKLVRRTTRKSR